MHTFDPPIIGSSPAIRKTRALIRRLAASRATVLIAGESGTGKELVARNLHLHAFGAGRPFVALNCAALNPGVLESELFGHARGSFTGAVQSHVGLFEQANGGTIFLDEIGDIDASVQAKLLRTLQEKEIRRLGATATTSVNVRVIAATNACLEERVRLGKFRLDLFYRIAVIEIHAPALRDRGDDVFEIIDHILARRGGDMPRFDRDARDLLMRYRWPGNVRELDNELERITALYPGCDIVTARMLSARIQRGPDDGDLDLSQLYDTPLPKAVGYLEENMLRRALEETNWNKSKSARQLGLSRQGLLKKIKRYGIHPGEQAPDEPGDVVDHSAAESHPL